MMIDLRSDTVTKPTKGMLDAMFNAEVGDDVFGEDPTINLLEAKTAAMFGMEAGLFCPSGTMTNQIAIKLHTQPGDEVICDRSAHIYNYEGGGIAFNSGASVRLLQGDRGRFTAADVVENINPPNDHYARTSLVCVENTSNRGGGSYYTLQQLSEIAKVSRGNHLKYHLDGARIFNALVETGNTPVETGQLFDSVSVCLSKGLGVPSGSVLVGSKDFIKRGRRIRKILGGGMRQAGFIAAAGIYALDNHVERLKEDHTRAKQLAEDLKTHTFVEEILPVDTNIVIFNLKKPLTSEKFVNAILEKNIKAIPFGPHTVRFVTHYDFTDEMLSNTLDVLKTLRL